MIILPIMTITVKMVKYGRIYYYEIENRIRYEINRKPLN